MKDRIFFIIYVFLNSFLCLVPNIYYYVDNINNFTTTERAYYDYIILYSVCLSVCQYALMYSATNKYNILIHASIIFATNAAIFIFNIINIINQSTLVIYSINACYYLVSELILLIYFFVWCYYNRFNKKEYEKHMNLIEL
jgi:hypothetical protein